MTDCLKQVPKKADPSTITVSEQVPEKADPSTEPVSSTIDLDKTDPQKAEPGRTEPQQTEAQTTEPEKTASKAEGEVGANTLSFSSITNCNRFEAQR